MRQGAQLVYRLADILKGLAESNRDGIGMTDLARTTGLKGPTVHRLLQAMTDVGLAYQRPGDRRYVLGSLLYELGRTAGDRFDLQSICDAQTAALAQATGDTAFFLIRSAHNMLCLSRSSGSFPIKTLITEVGTRRPIGVGAGGLAVLAALPREEATAIMKANEQAYIDAGRSLPEIVEEVELSHARGYVRRDMPALGATTMALVVRDKAGYPFASVSASSISQRMRNEHLALVLEQMAAAVTRIEQKIDFDIRRVTEHLSL